LKIFAANSKADRYRQPGRAAQDNIETTTNDLTITNGFFINTAALNNWRRGERGDRRPSRVVSVSARTATNELVFRQKPSAFLPSIIGEIL
jgi:hypothetical protein